MTITEALARGGATLARELSLITGFDRHGGVFGNEFTIVEVRADNLVHPTTEFWIAAAKPSQAVTLVLSKVSEGWTADVMTGKPSEALLRHLAELRLKPGEVRKLTK